MNETINVKETVEGATGRPPLGTCPADIKASIRVQELAEAIARYASSTEHTVSGTDRCMVYAEELMDQLALMKKYGKQDAKWLAGGFR